MSMACGSRPSTSGTCCRASLKSGSATASWYAKLTSMAHALARGSPTLKKWCTWHAWEGGWVGGYVHTLGYRVYSLGFMD